MMTQTAVNLTLESGQIWIYSQGKLMIYLWQEGQYQSSLMSPNFPQLNLIKIVPELMQKSQIIGVSQTLLELAEMIATQV